MASRTRVCALSPHPPHFCTSAEQRKEGERGKKGEPNPVRHWLSPHGPCRALMSVRPPWGLLGCQQCPRAQSWPGSDSGPGSLLNGANPQRAWTGLTVNAGIRGRGTG